MNYLTGFLSAALLLPMQLLSLLLKFKNEYKEKRAALESQRQMNLLMIKSQIETLPNMRENIVYVYDKLDENSMMAAAVARHFGGIEFPSFIGKTASLLASAKPRLKVIEIGLLGQHNFDDKTIFVWLGLQPTKYVASRYRNHEHHVLLSTSNEEPIASNVRLYIDNELGMVTEERPSITGQVIRLVLNPLYRDDPVMLKTLEQWSAVGFMVSRFNSNDFHGESRAVTPSLTRTSWERSELTLAIVYNYIRMAYNYLTIDSAWIPVEQLDVERDDLRTMSYKLAVRDAKKLLEQNSVARIVERDGRIFFSRRVDHVDCLWYLARRLSDMTGQILRTPRLVDEQLYFKSNEAEALRG